MAISNAKRKALDELKGEIELKNDTLKAAQYIVAKQLKEGMGAQIRETLEQQNKKKTFCQRIKENIKKLNI